jgi:hypothetical protein
MNYYLTHEEASLIKNLLHKERIEYQYCDYTGNDAIYFKTVTDAISAMEHPEQYQSTVSE